MYGDHASDSHFTAVVISCILTTVRQFSTTSGPHWNVTYTPLKTAGVVHYRAAVRSRILSSLTEWQACILFDFQCRLHANVTTLQHFFTFYCQYAHVFCIQQWSVNVVHYKPTDKLDLIVAPKVWRPCKWFTVHCYVVISCILTTVRQFSTTSCPHWNVSYTLTKTAGVVHYRAAVHSSILLSLIEWQACNLQVISFSVQLTCKYAIITICSTFSPFIANMHTLSVYFIIIIINYYY